MTTTTPERDNLKARLREVLGTNEAETLMDLLPQEGEQPATKSDVARHDQRFDAVDRRFDAVERRLDAVDHRFEAVEGRLDRIDQGLEKIDDRMHSMQETLRDQLAFYSRTTVWAMTGLTGMFSAVVLIITRLL